MQTMEILRILSGSRKSVLNGLTHKHDLSFLHPLLQLNSVEVLLLCRLVGIEVGGDRARLQELIPALPALKWVHSSFAGVV